MQKNDYAAGSVPGVSRKGAKIKKGKKSVLLGSGLMQRADPMAAKQVPLRVSAPAAASARSPD